MFYCCFPGIRSTCRKLASEQGPNRELFKSMSRSSKYSAILHSFQVSLLFWHWSRFRTGFHFQLVFPCLFVYCILLTRAWFGPKANWLLPGTFLNYKRVHKWAGSLKGMAGLLIVQALNYAHTADERDWCGWGGVLVGQTRTNLEIASSNCPIFHPPMHFEPPTPLPRGQLQMA